MIVRVLYLREDITCQRVGPVAVEAELSGRFRATGMDANGMERAEPFDTVFHASGPFSRGTDTEMMAGF